MTVKNTQQTLNTTLEKTEQNLNGLEAALENNVGGRATGVDSAANERNAGLPEGWVGAKISDVAEVKGGKRLPKGKKLTSIVTDHPYIRVTDFDQESVDVTKIQYIDDDTFEAIKNYIISSDDLYISIAGTIGLVGEVPTRLNGANLTENAAKLCQISGADKDYLKYVLNSSLAKEQFEDKTTSSGQPKLALFRIKDCLFPLPPLAEQTVIAQILDTLLAQVDNIKNRLDAIPKILKTFRQSVLAAAVSGKLTEAWRGENECGEIKDDIKEILEARSKLVSKRTMIPEKHLESDEYEIPVAWRWVSLDSLSSKIVDGVHHKPEYVAEGVPFMSVKDINGGKMSFNYCKYISEETHKEIHPRCNPEKGDLLITKSGTIGRTAIVDTDDIFDLFVSVALIKPASDKVNMKYIDIALCQWVNSIDVSSRVVGTAIKNLHLRDMRVLAIPFAPIEEQTEIVRRVEELFAFADQIEQQVQNAQGRVNNLTQSILAKAFRGELTTQWRAENPDLITGDNSAEALLTKIQEEREKLKPKKAAKKKTTAKKTTQKKADD